MKLKAMVKYSLWLLMAISISAHAGVFGIGGKTMSWKEEVLLHDGKVIVMKRDFKLGGYPALDSHNRTVLSETITFTPPGWNRKISWESDSLGPLLLDVVDGVPYLAASPAGCIAYNKWKRPNPPYILFKFVNEEWSCIPLEEFPAQLVKSNLMSKPDSRELKSYYTVEQVKEHMGGRRSGIPEEAKTILREPLPKIHINQMCMEMIEYKGHWIMPNDPAARAMVDAKTNRNSR